MLRNSRLSRLSLLILAFILGILSSRIYDRVARPSLVQQPIQDRSVSGDQQKDPLQQSAPLADTSPSDHQLPPPPQPLQSKQHRGAWNSTERVNAAFVILVQNKELHDMRKAMRMLESTFNNKYGYPYVFLNDEPFTEHFKTHIIATTNAPVKFGQIPKEHWSYPPHINQTHAALCRKDMAMRQVPYGESESYRHMCRFESGFVAQHELVKDLEYYWRVEPGVEFSCELDFDPFLFMKTKKLKYGFTIALPEFVDTIPTLWDNVKRYMKLHPEHLHKRNSLEWLSYDDGETYNNCHFWTNFEIVSVPFLQSKAYMDLFRLLDDAGGFFYERWGDAPVRSIAAALTLDRKEIHFFNEIGYKHGIYEHCPESPALQLKCACDPEDNFDWVQFSCLRRFLET
ncbi:alpha 1,2-mannosyltransferase 2.4.1 [Mortierella alpina]|nr:alpha 1,2-mannosyltransferase 2.4.1 [Mortierella alpina]